MSYPDPEADFHSRLYVRLSDSLDEHGDAPSSGVRIEEDAAGGRADVFLQSHDVGSLVIEVERADVDPRSTGVVRQARSYAEAKGADFFATCNANDFFLYDYGGEVEVVRSHGCSRNPARPLPARFRPPHCVGVLPLALARDERSEPARSGTAPRIDRTTPATASTRRRAANRPEDASPTSSFLSDSV